jgi:pimeloyl-ACP methyl ester carboxylesterase
MVTHHRFAEIAGRRIFYREAGSPAAPGLVLLHGTPASSHQYRNLIPALADRYQVIAPDYPGFGHSDVPGVDEFSYTFNNFADRVDALLDHLGLQRYAIFGPDGALAFGRDLPHARSGSLTLEVSGVVAPHYSTVTDFARLRGLSTS